MDAEPKLCECGGKPAPGFVFVEGVGRKYLCGKCLSKAYAKHFPLDKTPCNLEHPGELCEPFRHLALPLNLCGCK